MEHVFDKVGEIYIEKFLGEGSYGKVYLVRDRNRKKYALKIMTYDESFKDELLYEIQLLSKLKNNNVCVPGVLCIFDYKIDLPNKKFYILMEYVDGKDVYALMSDSSFFTKEVFEDLFEQGIQYLAYIHQHGIIHRDIKPENLMIDKNLQLKFIDFGLSCEKYRCDDIGGTRIFTPIFYNNCEISDINAFGLSLFNIYYPDKLLYRYNDEETTPRPIHELIFFYEKGKSYIDKVAKKLNLDEKYVELWKNMIEPTGLLKFTATEIYSILQQNISVENAIPTEFQNCSYDGDEDWDMLLETFNQIEN